MKKDFLIVGAGLAGCLCAWELNKRNKTFLIVDQLSEPGASQVAAGIINPITGKRFVLIENFETYISTAQNLYQEFEHAFQKTFFQKKNIIRVFKNVKEHQFWNEERNKPQQQGYVKQYNSAGVYQEYIRDPFGSLSFQGYSVNGFELIDALRQHFKNHLKDEFLAYENLQINHTDITYKEDTFTHVLFCEGYRAMNNPFFDWIPFKHAKGEILIIQTEENHHPDGILNFGKWIQPLDEGLWKVGSTFEWEDINTNPTPAGLKELTTALNEFFPMKYVIKKHIAGVRPVVRDLNPLLGTHPEQPCLSMINGLGAKGYLYAPTYIPECIQFLLDKRPLLKEHSIERFF